MSDAAALEAELARLKGGDDPDRWALAAYRLAVARSELATDPSDLDEALDLLERAGRVLTPERAPVEHSRILTATASCHRAAGRTEQAVALFEQAAELAGSRVPLPEQVAALVNVGLTRAEAGRADGAVPALDAAVELLGDPTNEEEVRLLGAALVNRAQARQAVGDGASLEGATADYQRALRAFAPDSVQAGMAAHGLGAALLELNRRAPSPERLEEARAALDQALTVFGPTSHPFQHAVARHSLALAHEARGDSNDLARALDSLEASLSLFDPRLHQPQWRTAADALDRIQGVLDESHGPRSRVGHIVNLLATSTTEERGARLRERLLRVADQPLPRLETELGGLTETMAGMPLDDYDSLLRSLVEVLMELPDRVLEAACAALCRAHDACEDGDERDRTLDRVIHDILFGPQRVRVRDLLEANGWVRP